MYKGATSKVINNGYLSKPITLERGMKQGCPLSPYLIIIAIEILAERIRSNENIRGLQLNGIHSKLLMYADDTNINMKFKKLSKILQPWHGKKLTTFRKTTLVNTLIVSQLTYLMLALPTPAETGI